MESFITLLSVWLIQDQYIMLFDHLYTHFWYLAVFWNACLYSLYFSDRLTAAVAFLGGMVSQLRAYVAVMCAIGVASDTRRPIRTRSARGAARRVRAVAEHRRIRVQVTPPGALGASVRAPPGGRADQGRTGCSVRTDMWSRCTGRPPTGRSTTAANTSPSSRCR